MSKKPVLNWTPHPVMPIPDSSIILDKGWDKDISGMIEYHQRREDLIFNMKDDPYRYGHELDHWLKADELLRSGSEILCLGGNRCVDGDTLIYDPIKDTSTKISLLTGESHVLSWNGSRLVPAKASPPCRKNQDRIYRVTLEDGASFSCSLAHQVLLANGEFQPIRDVNVGDELLHPQTTSDTCPLKYDEDAQSSFQTPLDWMVDYSGDCHQYDEQPQRATDSDLASLPLRDDAPVYTSYASLHSDDPECKSQHSHPSSQCAPPSSLCAYLQTLAQSVDTLCRVFYTPYRYVSMLCEDLGLRLVDRLSSAVSNLRKSKGVSSQLGNQYLFSSSKDSNTVRVVKIEYLRDDYVWDLTVENYLNYWCEGVLQHNSGKTEWAGKRVVQAAMNNPESIIWCFQTTFENSVQMQQKVIWKYIPKELKNVKRDKVTNISYSQKRGFSDGKLVFPNGSEIVFRNYSQDITTIEGGEIGSMNPDEGCPFVHNIGFWADELIPQAWLDTLRFRLVTRDSVGIITFTPIEGYSPTVKEYLNGAITEEEIESDLIKGYKVPIVQQPKRKDSKIIYFQTKDNPYGGYDRIKKTLEGAHRDDILCRAHGVPVKPMAGKFPKFSHKHNVVKHDEIPFIKDKNAEVTHYMIIDPSGAKPWFMLWLGVTPLNEMYVWAEYPDEGYGDWADMSKGTRGRPGDACKPNGYGFQDYKDRMLEIEDGITIFERIIDPRLGATRFQKEDMQTTYIDELINIGIDTVPAPGYDEDTGLQSINKLLAWDDTKPMDLGNKPQLFFSDRCAQTIYSMTEYTGMLGKDEPTKDTVDCIRYAAVSDIMYVNEGESHFLRTTRR